jgi:hypothetical protein
VQLAENDLLLATSAHAPAPRRRFRAFPRLKVVITELGCYWVPDFLQKLDATVENLRRRTTGELRFKDGTMPTQLPSESFARNCWIAASQPRVSDADAGRSLPPGRFMWGNDYPHDEGTYPFTRETLRVVFDGYPESELRGARGQLGRALRVRPRCARSVRRAVRSAGQRDRATIDHDVRGTQPGPAPQHGSSLIRNFSRNTARR